MSITLGYVLGYPLAYGVNERRSGVSEKFCAITIGGHRLPHLNSLFLELAAGWDRPSKAIHVVQRQPLAQPLEANTRRDKG